jgi:hypothetical protein
MQSNIERQVMGSVAAIYLARQFVSAPALKLYVCVVALLSLGSLVWVARVVQNLAEVGITGALTFMLAAVLNTDFWVQLALLVLVAAGLSLVRDLARPVFGRKLHTA